MYLQRLRSFLLILLHASKMQSEIFSQFSLDKLAETHFSLCFLRVYWCLRYRHILVIKKLVIHNFCRELSSNIETFKKEKLNQLIAAVTYEYVLQTDALF